MLIAWTIPKDVARGRQGVSEGCRHGSVPPRVSPYPSGDKTGVKKLEPYILIYIRVLGSRALEMPGNQN